jgi:hypothetical protein
MSVSPPGWIGGMDECVSPPGWIGGMDECVPGWQALTRKLPNGL